MEKDNISHPGMSMLKNLKKHLVVDNNSKVKNKKNKIKKPKIKVEEVETENIVEMDSTLDLTPFLNITKPLPSKPVIIKRASIDDLKAKADSGKASEYRKRMVKHMKKINDRREEKHMPHRKVDEGQVLNLGKVEIKLEQAHKDLLVMWEMMHKCMETVGNLQSLIKGSRVALSTYDDKDYKSQGFAHKISVRIRHQLYPLKAYNICQISKEIDDLAITHGVVEYDIMRDNKVIEDLANVIACGAIYDIVDKRAESITVFIKIGKKVYSWVINSKNGLYSEFFSNLQKMGVTKEIAIELLSKNCFFECAGRRVNLNMSALENKIKDQMVIEHKVKIHGGMEQSQDQDRERPGVQKRQILEKDQTIPEARIEIAETLPSDVDEVQYVNQANKVVLTETKDDVKEGANINPGGITPQATEEELRVQRTMPYSLLAPTMVQQEKQAYETEIARLQAEPPVSKSPETLSSVIRNVQGIMEEGKTDGDKALGIFEQIEGYMKNLGKEVLDVSKTILGGKSKGNPWTTDVAQVDVSKSYYSDSPRGLNVKQNLSQQLAMATDDNQYLAVTNPTTGQVSRRSIRNRHSGPFTRLVRTVAINPLNHVPGQKTWPYMQWENDNSPCNLAVIEGGGSSFTSTGVELKASGDLFAILNAIKVDDLSSVTNLMRLNVSMVSNHQAKYIAMRVKDLLGPFQMGFNVVLLKLLLYMMIGVDNAKIDVERSVVNSYVKEVIGEGWLGYWPYKIDPFTVVDMTIPGGAPPQYCIREAFDLLQMRLNNTTGPVLGNYDEWNWLHDCAVVPITHMMVHNPVALTYWILCHMGYPYGIYTKDLEQFWVDGSANSYSMGYYPECSYASNNVYVPGPIGWVLLVIVDRVGTSGYYDIPLLGGITVNSNDPVTQVNIADALRLAFVGIPHNRASLYEAIRWWIGGCGNDAMWRETIMLAGELSTRVNALPTRVNYNDGNVPPGGFQILTNLWYTTGTIPLGIVYCDYSLDLNTNDMPAIHTLTSPSSRTCLSYTDVVEKGETHKIINYDAYVYLCVWAKTLIITGTHDIVLKHRGEVAIIDSIDDIALQIAKVADCYWSNIGVPLYELYQIGENHDLGDFKVGELGIRSIGEILDEVRDNKHWEIRRNGQFKARNHVNWITEYPFNTFYKCVPFVRLEFIELNKIYEELKLIRQTTSESYSLRGLKYNSDFNHTFKIFQPQAIDIEARLLLGSPQFSEEVDPISGYYWKDEHDVFVGWFAFPVCSALLGFSTLKRLGLSADNKFCRIPIHLLITTGCIPVRRSITRNTELTLVTRVHTDGALLRYIVRWDSQTRSKVYGVYARDSYLSNKMIDSYAESQLWGSRKRRPSVVSNIK